MKPTVRFGGGVWKHQEDVRLDLQRRLDDSGARLHDANAEIDRVHAQCVMLLREKNELTARLGESETLRLRHADELHAAKQNVTELMTLLTQANEARTRLETERSTVTKRWQMAHEHEQQAKRDSILLQQQRDENEQEAERLRDLLYTTQEANACQEDEIARQRHHIAVVVHSNEAKDRQIATLIRERDLFAQKLAHYRSRKTLSMLPKPRGSESSPSNDSCENVTWTDIAPTQNTVSPNNEINVVEFERQKQRLREVALQTKARLEKERTQNATLLQRIEALETSQQELLVRYREASIARRRRVVGIQLVVPASSNDIHPVKAA